MIERVSRLALFFMIVVTACAPVPPRPPAQAPAIPVTLRVGTGDSGQGLDPHREIIARFERENPNVKIVLEPVAGNSYYDRLFEQIDAGTAPDIMQIGDDAVPMFVQKGALLDLSPYLRGSLSLDPNIYLSGVFQPGAWQGRQYLLPKDFSPLAVYYNKKIFDRYQVAYPHEGWTWQDLLKTAQALTHLNADGTPETWGVQLPAAWPSGFEYWVSAAGASLISEDGKKFLGHMDSNESTAALQFYTDLYNWHKVAPPPVGITLFGGGNEEFATGKAAMLVTGRWPQSDFKRNPTIDLGVVGMPTGKKRTSVLFWSGFGIYNGSQNSEAAWRFLRFYAGPEGAQVWKDWGLPTVKAVAETSGLTRDPIEGVWLRELSYLVPRAYVFTARWGETGEPALRKAMERAITDPSADIAGLLREAAQQAQAALDGKR